ncbi:MAG: polysaccharide biosynthesis/export family protein [Fidelibacterota bacterium]
MRRINTWGLLSLLIIGIGELVAQNEETTPQTFQYMKKQTIQTIYQDISFEALPLERAIDPDTYMIGPGDQLHIVVTSLENKLFPGQPYDLFNPEIVEYYTMISPLGELSLASIGKIDVNNKTYTTVVNEIDSLVKSKTYKQVSVQVRLIGLRSFKVLLQGAVEYPGYVTVTPVTRLYDAIVKAKGVQKYGDSETIYLVRHGEKKEIKLKQFLLNGDLTQNPVLMEDDVIIIPFLPSVEGDEYNLTEYKTHQIIVHGFVRRPRGFSYVPGYRASDYIAMVGGPLNIGSIRRTRIYRADGSIIKSAYNEYVEPGDVVLVPESLRSQLFGNISILQTATAVATLILTYRAATGG